MASARSPLLWCSFTTLTTVDPYERTTTANCALSGIVESLLGTYAYEVPGARVRLIRLAHEPSVNLYQLTARAEVAVPVFCTTKGGCHPVGPPSLLAAWGR